MRTSSRGGSATAICTHMLCSQPILLLDTGLLTRPQCDSRDLSSTAHEDKGRLANHAPILMCRRSVGTSGLAMPLYQHPQALARLEVALFEGSQPGSWSELTTPEPVGRCQSLCGKSEHPELAGQTAFTVLVTITAQTSSKPGSNPASDRILSLEFAKFIPSPACSMYEACGHCDLFHLICRLYS